MSTDNVQLGHLFAEIVSSHDLPRFDEIVAPGYVNHNPFAEPGLEGVRKVFGAIIAGVPDLKVFAEDVFVSADGTRVVGRYRYEGTHTGNFLVLRGWRTPYSVTVSITKLPSRSTTTDCAPLSRRCRRKLSALVWR